jgi:hypothetical protein
LKQDKKMQRDSMENLYSDYITGDLDAAMQLSVENHLKASPDAQANVDALRRTMTQLDDMPTVEPPAWFHDNLMRRLEMEMENQAAAQKSKGWNWKQLFAPKALARGLAVIVVLLTLTAGAQMAGLNILAPFFPNRQQQQEEQEARSRKLAQITGLIGVRAEWRADGGGTAIVRIKANSPTAFDGVKVNYALTAFKSGKKPTEELLDIKSGELDVKSEQVVTIACESASSNALELVFHVNDGKMQHQDTKPVIFSTP